MPQPPPCPSPARGEGTPCPAAGPPVRPYEADPASIYAQSFAIVRAEARLGRFDPGMEAVAVRLIHACGMVEVADRLAWSSGATEAGREALAGGAAVVCDASMVAAGVIRERLPAGNAVVVTLDAEGVAERASVRATTRSAAAMELCA